MRRHSEAMHRYWGFVNALRDEGVELADARQTYREVRDEMGRLLTVDDADDEVVDFVLIELGYEIEDEEVEVEPPDIGVDYGYGLDDRYLDDEWLDAGEEVEVTGDLAYEERE